MTIETIILMQQLKSLRRSADELGMVMRTSQAYHDKDMARNQAMLDRINRQIAEIEPRLYWARLNELLHTPCWKYRVAA